MLYLVGSYALKHYGVDLGREPGDYDVFNSHTYGTTYLERNTNFVKYTEKGEIRKAKNGVVVDIFNKSFWDTDKLFLSIHGESVTFQLDASDTNCKMHCVVAPKEILYIMYRTTAEVYKDEKSVKDFELIQKAWPNQMYRHELYLQRLDETQEHFDKTKKAFFEQHGLKQYVDHDKLHEMVTTSWNKDKKPQYLSILDSKDSTKIDISKFQKLHNNEKIVLLAEEICVLLFERYFVHKTITEGFKDVYVKNFFNNSKLSITSKLISHVCEKGLKGEHSEIIDFAKANINNITREVYALKACLKKQALPQWFLNELQEQREKYLENK